jgi:hypothetical protein
MLRAVITKELRQNLVYLALVLTLCIIAYGQAEYSHAGIFSYYRTYPINVLLIPSVREGMPVLCALAGFLLGIFQPIADIKFDRWAFLIHRPASRALLFSGRAIAGMILYCVAMGIPLLALFIWAVSPAGGTYFLWQYTLPPIIAFLCGIAFYFAGLLISERDARFYGSRVVPLVLAAATFLAADALSTFSSALLVCILSISVLLVAALGSAVSHGFRLRAHPALRIATSLVLLVSFSVLLLIPVLRFREELIGRIEDAVRPTMGYPRVFRYYEMLEDGTFVIRTSEEARAGEPAKRSYSDLEGNPIEKPVDNHYASPESFLSSLPSGSSELLQQNPRPYTDLDSLVSTSTYVWPHPENTPPSRIDTLFFDHTRDRYYIYRDPGRQFIGTLGADGFIPPGNLAKPFERPYRMDGDILWTPHVAYLIDTRQFKTTPFFTAPPGDLILGLSWLYSMNSNVVNKFFITTDSTIYLLDRTTGHILVRFPRSFEARYSSVIFLPKINRFQFEWVDRNTNRATRGYDYFSAEGKLLSRKSFPPLANEYPMIPPSSRSLANAFRLQAIDGSLLAAASPGLMLAHDAIHHFDARQSEQYYTQNYTNYCLGDLYKIVSVSAFFATLGISTLIAWCLAHLYRLPSKWPWLLLTFLTGPAALFTLIATHTIPTRIKCPNCHVRRPIADPVCPNCKAPWPAPVQTGTEIFT